MAFFIGTLFLLINSRRKKQKRRGWDNEARTWRAPASKAPTWVQLLQIKSLGTSTKLCLIYAKKILKISLVPPPPCARNCPDLCRLVLLPTHRCRPTTLSSPSCRFTESIIMRLRYLIQQKLPLDFIWFHWLSGTWRQLISQLIHRNHFLGSVGCPWQGEQRECGDGMSSGNGGGRGGRSTGGSGIGMR
jgi:hypothetical protein